MQSYIAFEIPFKSMSHHQADQGETLLPSSFHFFVFNLLQRAISSTQGRNIAIVRKS